MAEIGQLSGRPDLSVFDARAVGDVEAIVVPPEALRALLVAEAELGERILRALILRRVALIETGFGCPVLIGSLKSPDVTRLSNFLGRSGIPFRVIDPQEDADASALLARFAPKPDELPIVLIPDGSVLKNPTKHDLARILGLVATTLRSEPYDVVIVGAGPAGMATAVYGASEGLSILVLEALSFGGQAGASARIENYLGFPTGISGQALMARAFTQAQKFGAEFSLSTEVKRLDCTSERSRPDPVLILELADGRQVRWRNRRTGAEEEHGIAHLFLFTGADPAASWLDGCGVPLDEKGFIRTGADVGTTERVLLPMETGVQGIFAVGDVRSGSVKRVGSAMGEGAAVVAQLHTFLSRRGSIASGARRVE